MTGKKFLKPISSYFYEIHLTFEIPASFLGLIWTCNTNLLVFLILMETLVLLQAARELHIKLQFFLFDPLIFFSLIVSEFVLFRYGFGVFVGKKYINFTKLWYFKFQKLENLQLLKGNELVFLVRVPPKKFNTLK